MCYVLCILRKENKKTIYLLSKRTDELERKRARKKASAVSYL